MNVFGEKKRSWRKARKRGVSPIIATILLVAITVVLAAVLYVLISGLTSGPGNAPLGSHFGWGTASNNTTGSSAAFTYSLGIASASGITTSNLHLTATSATGSTVSLSGIAIKLVSATGAVVATYSVSGSSWTLSASASSSTVTSGMSIWITTAGLTRTDSLSGVSLVAIGAGSYSGTVAASAFP